MLFVFNDRYIFFLKRKLKAIKIKIRCAIFSFHPSMQNEKDNYEQKKQNRK